jgi:hypothetical protein
MSIQQQPVKKESITLRLTEWVEIQQGTGLILFYWFFIMNFLSTLVLLCLGIAHSNPWLFFSGVLSLRLFVYLFKIGRSFLKRIDPE